MATVARLNVEIAAFVKPLQDGLKQAERSLRQSGARMSRIGDDISASLSIPLGLLGGAAIKAAGDFEALRLAMRSTFQNAGRSIQEADAEVEKLRESAKAPGLDFEQAIKASIRLQAVGLSAENARHTIEELANAVASTGGTAANLESVTVQMSQMISKGKILSQDLRIVQENLPIISSLMQKAFGTSNAEAIQKLGISGTEFVTKITAEMGKLARVQGGISNSLVNAGSAFKVFLANIGEEINKVFDLNKQSERLGETLQAVSDWFKGLSDETKKFIVQAGLAVVAIGPVLKIFSGIAGLGASVAGAFKFMLDGVVGLGGGVIKLIQGIRALGFAFSALSIVAAVAGILALADAMGYFNKEATTAEKIQASLNTLTDDAEKSIQSEKAAASTLIGVLQSETTSRKAKAQALKDLKEISPEYFGQLRLENGLVVGLTDSYNAYIANLYLAAKAKKAEQRLVEIDQQKSDLLKAQVADQAKLNALKKDAPVRRGGFNTNDNLEFDASGRTSEAGAIAARISESQRVIAQLDQEAAEYTKVAEAGFEAMAKQKAEAEQRSKLDEKRVKDLNDQTDATGKLTKQQKVLKEVLSDIQAEADRQKLLGLDDVEAKLKVAESGLKRLLDAGWKPTTAEVMKLAEETRALQKEWDNIKDLKPVKLEIDIIRKDNGERALPDAPIPVDTSKNKPSDQYLKEQKAAQDWANAKKNIAESAEQYGFEIFNNIADRKKERMIADIEEEGKKRMAAAEGNAALQKKIQEDLDKKRAQIEKKAALRHKLLALAEASINVAVAITKAISSAPFPANLPAIVQASAIGALQLAAIATQKFAAGTRDAPGGLALVGERGPELVSIPKHSKVFSAGQTATALRGNATGLNVSGEFTIKGTDLVLILERTQNKASRFK